MAASDDDPPLFQVLNEIGIIAQLSRTMLERALPDGLKVAHFSVLNHFVRLEGTLGPARSPAQLARAFQVTKAAMTNTLQRLESRGLVEITPDAHDGRAKVVHITPAGVAMRQQALETISREYAPLAGAIGEVPGAILPFLRDLRARLDSARD